jgi:hypothetical protein
MELNKLKHNTTTGDSEHKQTEDADMHPLEADGLRLLDFSRIAPNDDLRLSIDSGFPVFANGLID